LTANKGNAYLHKIKFDPSEDILDDLFIDEEGAIIRKSTG